jgi:AcrR family transcriptional regulator
VFSPLADLRHRKAATVTAEPTQATPPVDPAVPAAASATDAVGTGAPGVRTRGQHLRRSRIIQAASALAARGGIEEMQMRRVADRAGVALGTLYRYFPSKMDLVVAVVSEELDLLEASLARRPPSARTPAMRAVDVLMRATRGLMREPELADALIRSLITSDVQTDFGDRLAGLLSQAASTSPAGARADGEPDGSRRHILVSALTSVWVMEMITLLRGQRTLDEIQRRIDLVADRLLEDF